MSVHLVSLVWEIRFPTQTQKLIMLRMADYANDDGDSVYPSNDQIARQCGCTKRGAQYILRGFHNSGLMVVTEEGGGGPKTTNKRKIDVDLLIDIALANRTLEGSKEDLRVVDTKGELSAPYIIRRVHARAIRVNSERNKGEPGFTRSLNNNHIEHLDASAGARDSSRTSPAVEKLVPSLTVSIGDASWADWMSHLDSGIQPLAEARGRLEVSKRWPDANAVLHTQFPKSNASGLTDLSKRISGESE